MGYYTNQMFVELLQKIGGKFTDRKNNKQKKKDKSGRQSNDDRNDNG